MSDPLRSLADAARAVTAAATVDDVLEIVADAARDVIGTRHGVARRGSDGAPPGPRLVAPLVARDGSSLGLIELWDKNGEFTADDEAIVIQLAQMAANAIETLELLKREHAARVEAEETGRRLLLEKQRAEALQRVGSAIAGRLELQEIVQLATDSARELTPASFGAFFYNVVSDAGEAYMLYTLSGVERSAFERFPMPRNTAIFAPTFNGETNVRLDDVLADPRYGHSAPYHGMPEGHLPVRSYLAVPVIKSDGEVVGGLFFGHPEPGMFSAEDERMVEGIAAQSAIAIENARLYQERTRTAQTLQRALLPPHLPEVPGLELGVVYEAAGEGTAAGGDFYDIFPIGNGTWCFVVGDVCGTGAEAAAVTGLARHTIRSLTRAGFPIAPTLERLNAAILDEGERSRFLTLVGGTFRRDGARVRLSAVNAGHPAPFVVSTDRSVRRLGSAQTLLGVSDRVTYVAEDHVLEPGELMVALTDGVLERRNGSRMLEDSGVATDLARAGHLPAQAIAERLRRLAVDFADSPQSDDIAILALRVGG